MDDSKLDELKRQIQNLAEELREARIEQKTIVNEQRKMSNEQNKSINFQKGLACAAFVIIGLTVKIYNDNITQLHDTTNNTNGLLYRVAVVENKVAKLEQENDEKRGTK